MVGTPKRYFGEFGPEAVDVTIVFTGSALTDGGGLTCQKQKIPNKKQGNPLNILLNFRYALTRNDNKQNI